MHRVCAQGVDERMINVHQLLLLLSLLLGMDSGRMNRKTDKQTGRQN